MLLFDLDGTLFDSKQFLVQSSIDLLDKYFPGMYDKQTISDRFGDGFSRFLPQDSQELATAALQEFIALKEEQYHFNAPLFPGVRKGLDALKNAGDFRLGVVTNQNRQVSLNALVEHKIRDYFEVVVALEDVKEGKPSPQGIEDGLQKMGVESEPEVTAMVGDSRADVLAARNAGFTSYLLTWYPEAVAAKQYKPDDVFSNFDQFIEHILQFP